MAKRPKKLLVLESIRWYESRDIDIKGSTGTIALTIIKTLKVEEYITDVKFAQPN